MSTEKEEMKAESKPQTKTELVNPTLRHLMSAEYKNQIALCIPKHITSDQMNRNLLTEFRKNNALWNCAPATVLGAMMQCSQLGLMPGAILGHAYFLPFWNSKENSYDCQLIIGYRGMLELARRSGSINNIYAYGVYSQDIFRMELGLNPVLEHIPGDHDRNIDDLIGVYAVAHLKDGGSQFEYLSRKDIDKARSFSKAASKNSSPWHSHYEDMARKTAIRKLFKLLPVSIELAGAIHADENADLGKRPKIDMLNFTDINYVDDDDSVPKKKSKTESLVDALNG